MNYKTIEQVRSNLKLSIESFGDNPFSPADLRNKTTAGVGTVHRNLKILLYNGSIVFDKTSTKTRKIYKVVKPLNFDIPKELVEVRKPRILKETKIKKGIKMQNQSIPNRILSNTPDEYFTKNEVWDNINDTSINKISFSTAFTPMVKKGLLDRIGNKKNGKYKITALGVQTRTNVTQEVTTPSTKLIVEKNNDNLSIKNETFYHIASFDFEEVFSTHDVTDALKKLFPKIEEKNVRTPMTRFMKLGVINRVGKNEYKKNLDYDFNVLPGHPDTVVASYSKNFNPKECTNKYAIAKLQYAKVAEYIEGDVLVFSGPNVEKHVAATKSITKGKHKLHLIDNDPMVFKHILTKINKLDSNVNLIFSNVMDIRINAQFQDLDFCSSWIGKVDDEYDPGEIAAVRLMEQAEKGYPVSALSFTFSKRGMSDIETIKAVNNIIHCLGASVKSFDGVNRGFGEGKNVLPQVKTEGNLKYGKKHFPIFRVKGRIIELEFYTYRDTGHMMSCLVIYK